MLFSLFEAFNVGLREFKAITWQKLGLMTKPSTLDLSTFVLGIFALLFFYPLQNTAGVRRSVTAEDIRLIPHVERDAKVYCGDHHQRGLIGSLVASRPVYYYDESNGP